MSRPLLSAVVGLAVASSACTQTCPAGQTLVAGRCIARLDGGMPEVCDPAGRDEDGDPSTLGRDEDGDGVPAPTCCNVQPDGGLRCGTDCDDDDATVHPGAPELCNTRDDDCDGVIDGAAADAWCNEPAQLGPNVATAACLPGNCAPATCEGTYLDCTPTPGCETDGSEDVAQCGACGRACAHPSCAAGVCVDDLAQIAAGTSHVCGVRGSGRMACWGLGASMQLGDGSTMDATRPLALAAPDDSVDVAAGDTHSCAVRASGVVVCWGSNGAGELGDGTTASAATPRATSVTDARDVEAGTAFTCALRTGGGVSCWGTNGSGQLGDGTIVPHDVPRSVTTLPEAALRLSTGDTHACVVLAGGGVACWGANASGQLGDGTTMPRLAPVRVSSIADATQLSAGTTHSCAVRASGQVWCWGTGALGDGSSAPRPLPGAVDTIADATEVSCGNGFSCAVRTTGDVACWGANDAGQLGDGTTMVRLSPVAVGGLHDAIHVVAGAGFACATTRRGVVVCWGNGDHGQLGDGTTTSRATVAPVIDP